MNVFSHIVGCGVLLMLVGCNTHQDELTTSLSEEQINDLTVESDSIMANTSLAEIDQHLMAAAPVVADALISHPEGLEDIRQASVSRSVTNIGNEILLSSYLDTANISRNLSTDSALSFRQALVNSTEIQTAQASVPYFQVELINAPDMTAENTWVFPMTYQIDDTEIEFLTGYSLNGEHRQFTPAEINATPSIVLGINEKIDYLSEVQKGELEGVQLKGAYSRAIVTKMQILDFKEIGEPEYYVYAAVGNSKKKFEKEDFEKGGLVGNWAYPNELLFTVEYTNCAQAKWGMAMWEDDFSAWRKKRTLKSKYACGGRQYEVFYQTRGRFIGSGDDFMVEGYGTTAPKQDTIKSKNAIVYWKTI